MGIRVCTRSHFNSAGKERGSANICVCDRGSDAGAEIAATVPVARRKGRPRPLARLSESRGGADAGARTVLECAQECHLLEVSASRPEKLREPGEFSGRYGDWESWLLFFVPFAALLGDDMVGFIIDMVATPYSATHRRYDRRWHDALPDI